MKSLLLSAASVLVLSANAFAADLPVPPVEEIVAPAAATYDWSGFYIGAQIGGAWLHDDCNDDDDDDDDDDSCDTGSIVNEDLDEAGIDLFGDDDDDDDGDASFSAGIVVGADWQMNGFVLGALADVNWVDLEESRGITEVIQEEIFDDLPDEDGIEPNVVAATSLDQLDWYGTARLRGGVAAGRALFYGTGGLAFGGGDFESSATTVFGDEDIEGDGTAENPFVFADGTALPDGCEAFSEPDEDLTDGDADFAVCESGGDDDDDIRVGFSVGAGVDFLVTEKFSIGAEYLYVNLGDGEDDDEDDDGSDFDFADDDDDDDDNDLDLSTVRVKAAYRF